MTAGSGMSLPLPTLMGTRHQSLLQHCVSVVAHSPCRDHTQWYFRLRQGFLLRHPREQTCRLHREPGNRL